LVANIGTIKRTRSLVFCWEVILSHYPSNRE
jgi:hypothetical protein